VVLESIFGELQHVGVAGVAGVFEAEQIPGQGTNPEDTLPGFILGTLL
jgi:hypothetical protein